MDKIVLTVCILMVSWAIVMCDSSTEAPTVEEECNKLKECDTCAKNAKCLWCNKPPSGTIKCTAYPVGQVIPKGDVCPLSDARWGVCWMNYKALLISMGIIAGVIVLTISCCCVYCCCCRGNASRRRRYQEEDARVERERAERETRNAERRAERQTKYDEIRRKYGLTKDEGYKRFDNE